MGACRRCGADVSACVCYHRYMVGSLINRIEDGVTVNADETINRNDLKENEKLMGFCICNRSGRECTCTQAQPAVGNITFDNSGRIEKIEAEMEEEIKTMDATQEITKRLSYLQSDPALRHLPTVLLNCLTVMAERSAKYNKKGNSCYDNCFSDGDAEGYISAKQVYKRLQSAINGGDVLNRNVPDEKIEEVELLEDGVNWHLIWACCREERRQRNA